MIKTVKFSSELFQGFTTQIDTNDVVSIDEIIIISISILRNLLHTNNLENLVKKCDSINWHIHDKNFSQLINCNDNIIWICDKCVKS